MADKLLWVDKKRHLGLPISITKYKITNTRIFVETGLLNLREEEILLYRVRDITLTRTFGQRLCGVGTIHVYASDKTSSHTDLINIKHPKEVKELLFENVENAKMNRGIHTTEIIGNEDI